MFNASTVTVMVVERPKGRITAWKGPGGFYVSRRDGETEEELAERVLVEARTVSKFKVWGLVAVMEA